MFIKEDYGTIDAPDYSMEWSDTIECTNGWYKLCELPEFDSSIIDGYFNKMFIIYGHHNAVNANWGATIPELALSPSSSAYFGKIYTSTGSLSIRTFDMTTGSISIDFNYGASEAFLVDFILVVTELI